MLMFLPNLNMGAGPAAAPAVTTVDFTHQMHRRRRGDMILIPFLVLELMKRWWN